MTDDQIAMMFASLLLILTTVAFSVSAHEGRIAGGAIVQESTAFPFQCALQYSGDHECGCVILNEWFILTAAHCTRVPLGMLLTLKVGTTHINEGGQNYEVSRITEHPDFEPKNISSPNLAIIELPFPLVFTASVQPAVLAVLGQVTPSGSPATALGWGFTADVGPQSPNLKEASLEILDLSECTTAYEGLEQITDQKICAIPAPGTTDATCNHDDGGPVLVMGEVHGIISFPAPGACGNPLESLPGVYTRVAAFRDWIDENSQPPAP